MSRLLGFGLFYLMFVYQNNFLSNRKIRIRFILQSSRPISCFNTVASWISPPIVIRHVWYGILAFVTNWEEKRLLLTCHFWIVGDADTTHLVVTGGRHLSSAAGSMAKERKPLTRVLVYTNLKIARCNSSSKHGVSSWDSRKRFTRMTLDKQSKGSIYQGA